MSSKGSTALVAGVGAAVIAAALALVNPADKDSTAASPPDAASSVSTLSIALTPSQASDGKPSAAPAPPPTAASGQSATTLALLDTLPVKGRAPKTGYNRVGKFGPAWTDNVTVEGGGNSCRTREDILKRDLTNVVFKKGTNNCIVLSGTLNDPYTGKTIPFQRGAKTSAAIQIDHVVALSASWQTGAQQLSQAERVNFANDPDNLLASDGPANMAKGDGDAATWLPPNKSFRCRYVSLQVKVKKKYHLWVTAPEKAAIQRVLQKC